MLLYNDAGTGSLVFQALAAGFLSIMFYAKRIYRYLKSFFIKKKDDNIINV